MRNLVVIAVVCVVLGWHDAAADAGPCAAGLVPNVDLTTATDRSKHAWLRLINKDNYAGALAKAETSGSVQVTDLFEIGEGKASYEEFKTKRDKYLSVEDREISLDQAVAYARYNVPLEARLKYFDCVASQFGIRVTFELETDTAVTARISYKSSDPGAPPQIYKLTISGATLVQNQRLTGLPIHSQGEDRIDLLRKEGSPEIRVTVQTTKNLSHTALSVRKRDAIVDDDGGKCTARQLLSDRLRYFNSNGIVRVNRATVTVKDDCSAILSFVAAAMEVVEVHGNDGPWLKFALLGPNGPLKTLEQIHVVTVSQCGGYQRHTVTLPGNVVPEADLRVATGFMLDMPGGSISTACTRTSVPQEP
jgi:hypothetical protein